MVRKTLRMITIDRNRTKAERQKFIVLVEPIIQLQGIIVTIRKALNCVYQEVTVKKRGGTF